MGDATVKRPRDTNQLAKKIVDLATGQDRDETEPADLKKRSAGRKGGAIRAKRLTPSRRSEIAQVAANARWAR